MLQDPNPPSRERRKSMDPVSQHIHLEDLPAPGNRFEIQELIGIGTCAKVFSAIDKEKDCKVAVKIIENIAENLLEIESEYRVLTKVDGHSLIPEFYGMYLHTPKAGRRQLWFVMELCEGVPVSNLLNWLCSVNRILKEEEISALLKVFMMAIHHLHENDIIYRDVRSDNLILSSTGEVKLVDFGSCALVRETEGKAHSSVGTPHWMAPEVIGCEQLRPYTKFSDVWSLGITAIELADSQPPLFNIHPVRAMFQIARNPPPTLKKAADWSEDFKDFINECLVRNADHRPCVLELMLHPFITEMDDVTKNQKLLPEQHLEQHFVPSIGERLKQILALLGELVRDNLYPVTVSKPATMTVKNWNFKTHPDVPYVKMLPDDLAAAENPSEESVLDHLHHRYLQEEVYSYIGDVLVAINPKKKLPIYEENVQGKYIEKARSDNQPHVFAVADRAYQQMLHHKRSQVILVFGRSGSGKSFSATQIISQLAFLSRDGNLGMVQKIRLLCPLLEAFGCCRTPLNNNSSRFLKNVGISFTKTGKITGAIISAVFLDRTRISSTPQNECNFHVLYYLYEGLKSEKRLAELGLDKLSSFRYLPQKKLFTAAELGAGYKRMCNAFKTLAFTDEEILVILRTLSAVLLLGDVTYTVKGSCATTNNPYLITSAAKNLSISHEKLNEIIGKGERVRDLERKRDEWVQFLYLRTFEWIVATINKHLSFSRLVLGDSFSVTVMDPLGFVANEHNQLFRLGSNVADDFLQSYIQKLMFFKELEEYKEEGVDIPFKYEGSQPQRLASNSLVEGQRKLLQDIQKASATNLLSEIKGCDGIDVGKGKVTIDHVTEKVAYNLQDLVNGTQKKEAATFIEVLGSSNDNLTVAIANKKKGNFLSEVEELLQLFHEMQEAMDEDFPHLVVCLQPSSLESSKEDLKFDQLHVMNQLKALNLMEMILIRQQGYARRLSFVEFLNRYKYLAFDFDEEVELSKENCQLLLIRLKMDGWEIGVNKVFLKYYAEEYLSRFYETHVKKIVRIQAMARRFIVKARQNRIK